MGDISKMEDIYKRWTEYLDSTRLRINDPPPEIHPYNQYEEEKTPTLESVFAEFTAYHATSTANQNSMQNQEIQVGKSYSMENYQWEQEKSLESTQQAFKSLEIQVGKLAEEVTKFVARREENFVEVEVHEESLVEEHDSKVKDEEKSEEKAQQWEKHSQVKIQQESILQVNTPPHQLIVKEEWHEEHEKALSVILSLIATTSLAITWKVLPKYTSFMASLAKRQKCKDDVFYVTFMPP
ncbi:hypothetical protein glysoja_041794 [Glycine soja]|uniref:Uncharacterized protein n=1 Tax=Glycine soja TaxID=3848 RepID=A0A0B2Q2J2_GLYSO|nr:hypothetical protein glysoja_041794 [Glycine soja]